jgi:hypothetical protein
MLKRYTRLNPEDLVKLQTKPQPSVAQFLRAVDRDLNEVRTATTRSRTTSYIVPLDYAVAWLVRRVDKSRDFRDGTFRTRRDVRCTAAIGGEADIVAVS